MIYTGRITRHDSAGWYVLAPQRDRAVEWGPMEASPDVAWADGDRVLITDDLDGTRGRFAILTRLPPPA